MERDKKMKKYEEKLETFIKAQSEKVDDKNEDLEIINEEEEISDTSSSSVGSSNQSSSSSYDIESVKSESAYDLKLQ